MGVPVILHGGDFIQSLRRQWEFLHRDSVLVQIGIGFHDQEIRDDFG